MKWQFSLAGLFLVTMVGVPIVLGLIRLALNAGLSLQTIGIVVAVIVAPVLLAVAKSQTL